MSSHKQTWIKHLLSEKQMSEAFVNSVFLALSGGFQDAYTYNTRDEVFSNAQTGNVVLMSQHFMNREWQIGLRCSLYWHLCLGSLLQKMYRTASSMLKKCTGGREFCWPK